MTLQILLINQFKTIRYNMFSKYKLTFMSVVLFTATIMLSFKSSADSGSTQPSDMENKITENTKSRIVIIGASYAKGLNIKEINGIPVINMGADGEQTHEVLKRFHRDVIALQPDKVLIWGFINDIHRSKRENIHNTLNTIKNNISSMVNLATQSNITPILTTEVTLKGPDGFMDSLKAFVGGLMGKQSYQEYINNHVININEWIKQFGEQNGILVLDIQPVISDNNNFRIKEYSKEDGSHISAKGYDKLEEYIIETLKNNVSK